MRSTWPQEDRIRWVEQRLKEWDSVESGRRPKDFAEQLPERNDLEVWLGKEREGLSWQQVAIRYFPDCFKRSKNAGMSMARRAHGRIEYAIAPPRRQLVNQLLDGRIRKLFGCTPEEFRKYLRRK